MRVIETRRGKRIGCLVLVLLAIAGCGSTSSSSKSGAASTSAAQEARLHPLGERTLRGGELAGLSSSGQASATSAAKWVVEDDVPGKPPKRGNCPAAQAWLPRGCSRRTRTVGPTRARTLARARVLLTGRRDIQWRKKAVSTVKKSGAMMLSACWRKNSRQLGAERGQARPPGVRVLVCSGRP